MQDQNLSPKNHGPENAGLENAGPENVGPENAGPGNAGLENVGPTIQREKCRTKVALKKQRCKEDVCLQCLY